MEWCKYLSSQSVSIIKKNVTYELLYKQRSYCENIIEIFMVFIVQQWLLAHPIT